jgi:hypothetical protein
VKWSQCFSSAKEARELDVGGWLNSLYRSELAIDPSEYEFGYSNAGIAALVHMLKMLENDSDSIRVAPFINHRVAHRLQVGADALRALQRSAIA